MTFFLCCRLTPVNPAGAAVAQLETNSKTKSKVGLLRPGTSSSSAKESDATLPGTPEHRVTFRPKSPTPSSQPQPLSHHLNVPFKAPRALNPPPQSRAKGKEELFQNLILYKNRVGQRFTRIARQLEEFGARLQVKDQEYELKLTYARILGECETPCVYQEKVRTDRQNQITEFYLARREKNWLYYRLDLKASPKEASDLLSVVEYFQQHVKFGFYKDATSQEFTATQECFSDNLDLKVISEWENVFDRDFLAFVKANPEKKSLEWALAIYEATKQVIAKNNHALEKVAKEQKALSNVLEAMKKQLMKQVDAKHAGHVSCRPVAEFLLKSFQVGKLHDLPTQEDILDAAGKAYLRSYNEAHLKRLVNVKS